MMGAPDERAVEAVARALYAESPDEHDSEYERSPDRDLYVKAARAAITAYEQVRPDPQDERPCRTCGGDGDRRVGSRTSEWGADIPCPDCGGSGVQDERARVVDEDQEAGIVWALRRAVSSLGAAAVAFRKLDEGTGYLPHIAAADAKRAEDEAREALRRYDRERDFGVARASGSPPVTPGRQPPEGER